jgi:hypothetical protein
VNTEILSRFKKRFTGTKKPDNFFEKKIFKIVVRNFKTNSPKVPPILFRKISKKYERDEGKIL